MIFALLILQATELMLLSSVTPIGVSLLKTAQALQSLCRGMFELVRFVVSLAARRFRSRAVLELENFALRHQLHVLRSQRPGHLQLLAIDRRRVAQGEMIVS